MKYSFLKKILSTALACSMLVSTPGQVLMQSNVTLYAEESTEMDIYSEAYDGGDGEAYYDSGSSDSIVDYSDPAGYDDSAYVPEDSYDPAFPEEYDAEGLPGMEEQIAENDEDDSWEEEEEDVLVDRTLKASVYPQRVYEHDKVPSDELKTVDELWQWLFGRDAEPDTNPSSDALSVKIQGELPEDVTAEAGFILFDEDKEYPERAIASIDVTLLRADGSEYIPESDLKVTIGGSPIKRVFKKGNPYILVYAHNEDSAAEALIVDMAEFSSHVTVYRELPQDGHEAQSEYWTKRAERLAYDEGHDHERISFYEDEDGLEMNGSKKNIKFKVEDGKPLHFIVSAQNPDAAEPVEQESEPMMPVIQIEDLDQDGQAAEEQSDAITPDETEIQTEAIEPIEILEETETAEETQPDLQAEIQTETAVSEAVEDLIEIEAAPETETVIETEAASETEAVSETELLIETEAVTEAAIVIETEAIDETETTIISEVETEAETEAETENIIETETEAEPEAETESESVEEELVNRNLRVRTDEGSLVSVSGLMPADVTAQVQNEDAVSYSEELEGEGLLAVDISLSREAGASEAASEEQDQNIEIAESEEYQPQAPVRVMITDPAIGDAIKNQADPEIYHIADDGTATKVENVRFIGNSAVFYADGFSVYVVVYTTQEGALQFSYKINDEETIELDDILNDLQISKESGEGVYTINDVSNVEFTEDGSLTVVKNENNWRISSSSVFSDPVDLTIHFNDEMNAVISVSCPDLTSITITADSETKVYDGYMLSNDGYSVEGLLAGDRIQSVVVEGSQTDVGDSPNVVRDAVIVNADGEDVTKFYDVSYVPGTLTVTPKPITITADSAEMVYDGTELTADTYTSIGLADGDVLDGVTVTGSQTIVGESDNTPSDAIIVRPVEGDEVVDVVNNYSITYQTGKLKVTPRELTITADSASKVYDGKELKKDAYTAEGLAEGDSVQAVTVTGSQIDAGTSENVPSAAVIINSDDEDVSNCYSITYKNGALEVTKKNVKLTAASSVQVYNGSQKTVEGFTVSSDGRQLDDIVFEGSISAYGSGTEEGNYPVTFTGVFLNETTDTTGNYIVTETEAGTLQIVESEPLDKSYTFSGDVAEYTITVNPEGRILNEGNDLTLRDTFSDNQSILYSSITSSDSRVTYDFNAYTGTFTIPDGASVTINYKTRVSGAAGTRASFENTAELGVTQNGAFASWYSKHLSATETITPSGTDIEGSGGVYTIQLFTYAQSHMEKGLGGAVFRLLDENQRPVSYRAGEQAGNPVTYTTGDNGYVTVELDDGIISLRKNTVYYLEMITAPVENIGGNYTYYQKDNTLYRFQITDDPSYTGDYSYFNGDVLKVRCYPEAAGVNVTKRFSGNYSLTDEQKNQIRFVLQKEDLVSGEWVDVESHTYGEFTNGSMNFETGHAGGEPLEEAVLYRVIEENSEIEGVDQSSTVILTYQRDNQTVQDYINQFEVDPDHSTYSFSLLFDNTYVDHRLTIVKMNELTGTVLENAEFTVYKASNDEVVKTYTTDENGTLEIRHDDDGANYAAGTAYYVVETKEPDGYLMPKNPERIYFYFSGDGSGVPDGIPSGMTAVDLTTSYDSAVIDNQTETVKVPVTVIWDVDGDKSWPVGVSSVISLYQSVNGEDPLPVERDGSPMTTTLNSGKTFDNTTFVDLPARDSDDNDITYSVVQESLPGYYTSYKVSGTGWYVVRNESAVSVTVKKEWYNLQGGIIEDAGEKQGVEFDLYRTTEDNTSVTTRDDLEALLLGKEPVMTGLPLSADNDWTNTVESLQKKDVDGNLYYYFALEREDSMPRNNDDSYVVVPAEEGSLRTLTIKNTQTPITVIIKAEDLTKPYGQEDPYFSFTTQVQDDACTVSAPVRGEDGSYTVSVTKDGETKTITFTCSREEGEHAGSYVIELEGETSQEGYRVRLDDGTLTITPAQVTVKGTATKIYGDPDPSLVEITGVKEGDTIAYYAYRDIGEQKGSYRITVSGLAKQGNYEITYINDYLTIEPAPVTVTADNISKAYGERDPALTVTVDGLKNQDAPSVIHYTISREEGDSVGKYPIIVTGDQAQGNYTVTYLGGIFTVTGKKVTVRARNKRKTYGDPDPDWDAEIEGLEEGDTLEIGFTREKGEDVGTYVITPSGESTQGYYEVTFETGVLTIERAPLTITPDNIIKALTDPITEDPKLTVTFEGLAEQDQGIVPTEDYTGGTWTYTYIREGETDPEFAFTVTRTSGETAGPYIIAATAFGERPKNYNITYKTGIFTILTTYNVVLNQQTRDLVNYTLNPEYSYTAVLDLSRIGIENYSAEGFVDNRMEFTLPADGSSSKTMSVPSGAKLTVTQDTTNPDYTTSITLDARDVEGTTIEIDPVNKAASIVVTHERIAMPVEARAAQHQTAEGKADEDGAVPVTPLAYLGIPRSEEEPHDPIPLSAADFIEELDSQGVYNLPEDKYYVPEHASVYNGERLVARNVQAIRYDVVSKTWQYRLDGEDFASFEEDDQLELFYMPQYICRVQQDEEPYYTLNEALNHIKDIATDKTGTIEMLIDRYNIPAVDNLSIPQDYNITLTTAVELDNPAVILRKPNNPDHLLSNEGTLTLDRVTLDGNKDRVTVNKAMVLNNGALTVSGDAILQNSSGNNGGAIYANSGSVTVEARAGFTGNNATNGGAIYFRDGSLSIASENISGNSATNGGAVYISDADSSHTLTLTGALKNNSATNGGAVYLAGGKLAVVENGSITENNAASGGAVFMTGGTLDLTGGSITKNHVTNGGAFYLTGGTLNMTGSSVSENTAAENGGMLYAGNATVSITGGSITDNSATNGGAILLASGSATIGGATIQENSAANGNGGAVCQTGGTLTVTGTIDSANTAKNGSAVYVENGSATFDGCNITGNVATEGGAVGVGSAEARLHFAGNAKVTGNTWNSGKGNLYLDQDTDLIINTAGLGANADIGVRVNDDYLSTRGDVGCKFGTYTGNSNLSKFKNDVNTGLTACDDNYKIIWSKGISVSVRRLESYAAGFPAVTTGTQITSFTYYPKGQENDIYDLVMEMYNAKYKSSITENDLYAYSFATTATAFESFLSNINWNSEAQRWDFIAQNGSTAAGTPGLRIYYSNGAYISIVNNSAYDLKVDSMTVLGKAVPVYGYPTVKNNITLDTLTPVIASDLVLKSGENVKLLFPGAVNKNWTINGIFTDPTTHEPVPNAPYKYTLDRNHGGTEQDGTANEEGKITHSGTTNSTAGGSYEILFGDPTYICKVTDSSGEHPFATLNAAWNYIVDNGLTYTMENGTTMPGGTIEMLIDYLQPLNDVLNISENSFENYSGYCLKLTTAATSGVQYPYVGAEGVTRATISRDSDNDGAAVIAMPFKGTQARKAEDCDAYLIVDNLTFDGKALAKKGNGGAISTANNVVTITRCDFKGYQASRGGAVFVAWGGLTIGGDNSAERCTFSNCNTGDKTTGIDKVGGGGIWTSAQHLVVKNTDFVDCACIEGNAQGGGIFHNIRKNSAEIYKGGDSTSYAKFPTDYYKNSKTKLIGCTFKDCYSLNGSGGTIECDSLVVEIDGCSFDGSYSNKNNANGGALNILHIDSFNENTVYPGASLTVKDSTFNNCKTQQGASSGGAICDQNSLNIDIINCDFTDCSSANGGAIRTGAGRSEAFVNNVSVSVLGSRFDNCTATTEGGAVHTNTKLLTISDTYQDDEGNNVTADASFKNCSAPKYGGVYQAGVMVGSEVTVSNVYFENCTSGTNNAGALMVNARSMSITGTPRTDEDDPYTFRGCSAGGSGGAVYHSPKETLKDTLESVSFYNCKAGAEGGGARLASSSIEITGTEIRDCQAVTNGGGLYLAGASKLTDCVFSANIATGETGNGGSLYINAGTVGITGGSISDSIAVNGGGIYNKGTLTISKGTDENSGIITNCAARTSGGGIYATGALTLDEAKISDCYAVTSGGGVYHSNNCYPYGTITKCYAGKGGGLYSNGYLGMDDATKTVEISDCHAATVTIIEGGTDVAEAEKQYNTDNLGGGIYKSAGNWNLKLAEATIRECSACDGGGVYYNSAGTLTYTAGNFIGNTASNNGGAIYKNAGTVTMSDGVIGGSDNDANHAKLGAGIFVADGQKITFGGGRITHNVASDGGAVAVGGNNANTQLLFQGNPVIKNNILESGETCNVYLNYDTNGIIRTSGTALTSGAYIGVYVTEEQFNRHGDYTMPFGTYNKTDNLASFFNDRIYAGGMRGSSNNQIIWGEFVCKITDADGNLLYTDETCETPAVYTTLENNAAENTTSAFGMLSYSSPKLYNKDDQYSGAYQIQMLVGDYNCASQMKIKTGSKEVTLTTASRTPDECGFCYTGTADQAVIRRNANYGSMIDTTYLSKLVIENITIDGGSKNGWKSTSKGGIMYLTGGTKVRLNQNTTLCNSDSQNNNGAGIRMEGSNNSHLYIYGAEIRNCVCTGYGGAISGKNGDITMNDGLITECSAGYGGGIVVERKMEMFGGTITGNTATSEGGGINLRPGANIHFSGNPVVSGNTLNGSPCNVHLINDNNTSIYAEGLGSFAEIRVYTAGSIMEKHGMNGKPFGTWTDSANLHCFINDLNPNLRGMKTTADKLVYWRENAFLTVSKTMDSDWSADNVAEFDFTVTIVGKGSFSGTYDDMTFVDGVATFKLKVGQSRTASGLPFDFIHDNVKYTVTEELDEAQTNVYTTKYSHNGGEPRTGTSVTGTFGENMSEDPLTSSSASYVEFINTRKHDDLTVSKTVTEGIQGDLTIPFAFTITLGDDTITKTYDAKRYQDQNDETGTDEKISFTDGVASFQLTHGQSFKILGLPKELGFKVEEVLTEDQYANFRPFVTADSGEETVSYSCSGKIGELKKVAFRNNRFGLVCKIVNDTAGREQLYYRENNDPDADPIPAIFDELEKAFEAVSDEINFFTADGAAAEIKLRIEMVKPQYEMKRQAVLSAGHNVTLGTALKTDRLYPYPTDADGSAVVTRGFDGGSMIKDEGNLTIDNITLDGGTESHTSTESGGIVQVNGSQTLTVTEKAILRNSATSLAGGAIWIGAGAGLIMNGTITNCQAANGGAVYADNGFGVGTARYLGIEVNGTISNCSALAGNGGAIYAGTSSSTDGFPDAVPLVLTGSSQLTGNSAGPASTGDNNTGCGGAIYSAANVKIDSSNVSISGNTAAMDGGGIYQSPGSALTMVGGTISDNTATTGNGGGLWAQNATIADGSFSGNKANGKTVTEGGVVKTVNGMGGAIYTNTSSEVAITGTSFIDNEACQGGAVYDQAESFVMTDTNMTDNKATEKGGAVYVANEHSFNMTGGTISGNSSPEGAISAGGDDGAKKYASLNFSGNASVTGNTAEDGTTAMNVFLGYHSNTVINAINLTGTGLIGVYVKDGDNQNIYHNHGIANRPFGTGTSENLQKFVNDRDVSLTGIQGEDGLIMWRGKDLVIRVYQNKENNQGQRTTPVGGAKFILSTVEADDSEGITLWSGESNASTGLLTIPWGITETEGGNQVTFTRKDENGNVISVSYVLTQLEANADTVRPAGSWKLTVAPDNTITWGVISPKAEDADPSASEGGEGSEEDLTQNVNRTLNVEAQSTGASSLGDVFVLYNDVKPRITFDPDGGILAGRTDSSSRTDIIDFGPSDLQYTYKLEESNPTKASAVFRVWSTVKNPTEGDGHKEYKLGDEMLFYRHSDNDDVTLYALWSGVICKITDVNDNLLYVNGSPAVYMSLKAGFDDFNNAEFTLNGVKATPRKIKMLVPEYEMKEAVELARGKRAELTTAPSTDTDGYSGPQTTCVISRANSFDTGSMITDNYSLTLRNIILDGAVKDSSGDAIPVEGDGGIIAVQGSASNLTLAQGAVLRNATVSGNGGAIYAPENTTVTVSTGSAITGCKAANGGGIYSVGTVNISGGEIKNNSAEIDAEDPVTDDEDAAAMGGGIYAAGTVNISGGTISGNSAANGGGIYSDGSVTLKNTSTVISGNIASMNGGGVYVNTNGSLVLSSGSIGTSGNPNTAVNGSGVYLAGSAQLNGGSISYNGTEDSEKGGGLYIAGESDIILNGTQLSYNTAAEGGAVYAAGPEQEGENELTLTLAKGTISNNTASGNGGGVYVSLKLAFNMTGGTINANIAQNGGGAYVASGSTMTLSGGTVSSNRAQSEIEEGTGNTDIEGGSGSGAAVYVEGETEDSYGILRVTSGTISGNSAQTFGGAVYLNGYGQLHVSGGTISKNAAGDANGGAVNAEGSNARIYLSGSPTIFDNPGSAATTSQKNVVLSEAQTTIINTEENGLKNKMTKGAGGTIGIYVIDEDSEHRDVYANHGVYGKPFATFGGGTGEDRENARHLVNDRNLSLYGVPKDDEGDVSIYWLDVVCKVTTADDELLYRFVNVDNSGVNVYAPAVYTSLADGFEAVSSSSLYRKVGSRYYAAANTGAVKVKMLKDYELDEDEIIRYETARDVTLTTAETEISEAMSDIGDSFIFTPVQGTEGERAVKATLTRAQTNSSMFTVNTEKNRFNVADIIIDGGSNTMLTDENVNGGAFDIEAVSDSAFTGVTMKNLNATGNGGAIYFASGSLTFTDSTIETCAAVNGGAIYFAADSLTLTDGTIETCTAVNGGGVYLADGTTRILGDTRIASNIADKEGEAQTTEENGAGIYLAAGTLSISDEGVSISNNTAEGRGGAVYAAGGVFELSGGTIAQNTVSENGSGAGIYLVENSALKLSGSPDFNGEGTEKGNLVNASLTGMTNGQEPYTKYRQDIFVAGYLGKTSDADDSTAKPATSIVVTGAIGSGNGSIWVAAEKPEETQEDNHYYMLKQFAVFESEEVKTALVENNTLESTMHAFRNGWDDNTTGCGADYLTGQEGEDLTDTNNATWKCIYWTGGFDLVFRKIDGNGKALDGAIFDLYKSNSEGTILEEDGERVAYEKSGTPVTGESAEIAAADAVTIKVKGGTETDPRAVDKMVYGDGLVKFEKIPPGTYFLVERTNADGTITINMNKYKPSAEMYKIVLNGKGWYDIFVAGKDDAGNPVWTEAAQSEAASTPFVNDGTVTDPTKTKKYTTPTEPVTPESDTIEMYTVMNVSAISRRVILRKVNGSYEPLPGMKFNLYAADGTLIEENLESKDSSGVFYIGTLPFGLYYIDETDTGESGYPVPTEGEYFRFGVNEQGVVSWTEGSTTYTPTKELRLSEGSEITNNEDATSPDGDSTTGNSGTNSGTGEGVNPGNPNNNNESGGNSQGGSGGSGNPSGGSTTPDIPSSGGNGTDTDNSPLIGEDDMWGTVTGDVKMEEIDSGYTFTTNDGVVHEGKKAYVWPTQSYTELGLDQNKDKFSVLAGTLISYNGELYLLKEDFAQGVNQLNQILSHTIKLNSNPTVLTDENFTRNDPPEYPENITVANTTVFYTNGTDYWVLVKDGSPKTPLYDENRWVNITHMLK